MRELQLNTNSVKAKYNVLINENQAFHKNCKLHQERYRLPGANCKQKVVIKSESLFHNGSNNHFPNNFYIKRKYSPSCLRIWKTIYGFYQMVTNL